MDISWDKFGKKAYQGIKDAGAAATIIKKTQGAYDIATGVNAITETEYSTHAVIKNFKADMQQLVGPEDVEIIFHSGSIPDTLPDLMDEQHLQIETQGKIYNIESLKVVRPAGVTMIYKARCVEAGIDE